MRSFFPHQCVFTRQLESFKLKVTSRLMDGLYSQNNSEKSVLRSDRLLIDWQPIGYLIDQ